MRPLVLGTLTAELDAEGGGTYSCPGGGRSGGFRGPAKLIARAAVFESGSGRTTVNQTSAPVHPERYYIGLDSGTTKVEAGNELVVEGVTVDWLGKPVTDVETVELELIRLESEYGWYYDEARGHESYRRYLRPVTEATTIGDRRRRQVSRRLETGTRSRLVPGARIGRGGPHRPRA